MTRKSLLQSLISLALFSILVIFSNPSNATTWYFTTSGSDSNSGTSSSPWLNPGAHNSSYAAGDVLSVAAGTYTPTYGWGLGASGSATGGYITLQCAPNLGTQLRVTTNYQAGILLTAGASYWDIRGCDVSATGTNAGGIAISGQFSAPFGPLHHIIIEGNAVHGVSCNGIGAAGNTNVNGSTVYATDYITIRNNIVYGNAFTSGYHCSGISIYEPVQYNTTAGNHIVIQGNVVYGNHDCDSCGNPTDGNGIILDDFKYTQNTFSGYSSYTPATLVANNVVYNNGGKGIHVFESQNATIQGNAAWGNNQDSNVCATGSYGGYEIGASGSTGVTVTSNEAQTGAATCDGYQIYAFEENPSGTSSSDTFTNNTGFAIFGSTNNVGYFSSPPSAYYSTLSGYSFGTTNK